MMEAVSPHYDIIFWSQTSWRWLEQKLVELDVRLRDCSCHRSYARTDPSRADHRLDGALVSHCDDRGPKSHVLRLLDSR